MKVSAIATVFALTTAASAQLNNIPKCAVSHHCTLTSRITKLILLSWHASLDPSAATAARISATLLVTARREPNSSARSSLAPRRPALRQTRRPLSRPWRRPARALVPPSRSPMTRQLPLRSSSPPLSQPLLALQSLPASNPQPPVLIWPVRSPRQSHPPCPVPPLSPPLLLPLPLLTLTLTPLPTLVPTLALLLAPRPPLHLSSLLVLPTPPRPLA
jgi:hypothetical protein